MSDPRRDPIIIRRRPRGDESRLPTSLPEVLRRVYAARRISSPTDIDHRLHALAAPELRGMAAATELLAAALDHGWHTVVVGDFDADGATGTALAVRGLRELGGHASYLVPNRFRYGYGLTPEIVDVAAQRHPQLLITVDNGISSIEGVARAREHGMRVIVTDHHLPGQELPNADAIVNPNQPDCVFPSKSLSGVGVVFYVLLALRAYLRKHRWFERHSRPEPNLARYLDLVALGTVADMVALDRNNRILVEQGLRRMRAGHCLPGIQALAEVSGRNLTRLQAADIGFALAPRLNAAGRLTDMSLGIECLLCDDMQQARALAAQLQELNGERREIERGMQEQALQAVANLQRQQEELPVGLCLYEPTWHQGVIGIIAARVRERLHRPVIVFADDGIDTVKGSARSVDGLHMRDALAAVASRYPGLIGRFGGHAMAAGLSLSAHHLQRFGEAFDEQVRATLEADALRGEVLSDGELSGDELSLATAEALRLGGPWGAGFPEPVFDGEFEIEAQRVVGARHLKLLLRSSADDPPIEAIQFNAVDDRHEPLERHAHLAYRLQVNEFRGSRTLQLVVLGFAAS